MFRSKDTMFLDRRSQRKGGRFLYFSLFIILLDQITKYLCVLNIEQNTRGIEVFPFFNLVHVYNYGAAFSIFADMGGVQRYFLSAIAAVLALIFIFMLLKTKARDFYSCLSYALFIGGAIGNLIDRLIHGYVIDFLLFYIKNSQNEIIWAYPAFNVADIAVCLGAFLLVLVSLFHKKEKRYD